MTSTVSSITSISKAHGYLVLVGLVIIGLGSTSLLGLDVPSNIGLGIVFIIFGVIGFVLTSTFGSVVSGLSDSQQSKLMSVASMLIALGGVSVPLDPSQWYVGLSIAVLGVVGHVIKETVGTSTPISVPSITTTTSTTPTQ